MEVSEQPSEERLVPVAADLIERQVQEVGLFLAEVYEYDGHGLETQAPGGDEPLMAADDYVVLVSGDDWLNEAKLAQRAGEGIEIGIADLTGVGGVRMQLVDRNLGDLQVCGRCLWHSPPSSPRRALRKTPALLGQNAFIQVVPFHEL